MPFSSISPVLSQPVASSGDDGLRRRVAELTAMVESVATANVTAAMLMAELEDTREELQLRNRELESQKVALQGALQQARSSDESNHAKGRFLANVSHEMRTPLNAMIGLSGLLLDSGLTSEQGSFARQMQQSAEMLLALINDLLDISKLEAGQFVLDNQEFELPDLFETAAELLAPQAVAKSLKLILAPKTQLPETVTGDPFRLRQILLNLLSNAVKFTSQGHVVLKPELVEESSDSVVLRISVSDTGIGIAAASLPRLFQPFAQLDNSSTRNQCGTGLGLAICRQLVESMGGTIGVSSEPGQGTTFWIQLRLSKGKSGSEATPVLDPQSRILIIDDCVPQRESLAAYVETWGAIAIESGSLDQIQSFAGEPLTQRDTIIIGEQLRDRWQESIASGATPPLVVHVHSFGSTSRPAEENGSGHQVSLTTPVRARELFAILSRKSHPLPGRLMAARQPVPSQLSGNVLIVEDNLINRVVFSTILRKFGVTVHEAANGKEALHAIEVMRYDLIFMDCQMPVMDGYEAVQRIRAAETLLGEGQHVPVIALTANAMSEDRRACLQAGMDAYATKPISAAAIGQLLERWLPQASPANAHQ